MEAIGADLGLSKMRISQILSRRGVEARPMRARRIFAPSRRHVTRPVVLTSLAEDILARTAERTGAGASHVVEYVVRLHAAGLTAGEFEDAKECAR